VPRTETKFDEGINGTAVAWYNVKDVAGKGTLFGAPKLHTTGAVPTDPTEVGRNFAANAPPITPDAGMDGYGLSATGKARFPQAGTYTFRLWNDDGARLWIDDTLVIDDWNNRTEGTATTGVVANFVAEAGKVYRFRLDYMHVGNPGLFELWTSGPGITDVSGVGNGTSHPVFLNPDYSLTTTAKVYDGTLGNSTSTTNYGSTPELGLAQSTTADPTGLNLTASSTYEAAATTGSYLRQTAKYLPGANTSVASTGTQYSYYTATDTKDNPCTTGTTEAYKQGGMLKTKTEPDPDGASSLTGRVTETIYDDAGKVVATRYNTDSWTCTTYDSRERPISVTIPTFNGAAARTVQNDYAVGGDPTETTSWDGQGWIVSWMDLFGRTIKYRDVHDDETTTTYDSLGRVTQRVSPLGTETYVYDNLNRMTDQKLDNVIYAHINYDSFSRVDNVTYPSAGSMKLQYARDALGRTNAYTYTMGNGTTAVSDTVTKTQSNQTTTDVVASGANSLWYNYSYDTVGRLTGTTVGANTLSYGFGTESSTCNSVAGNNTNAGKNSNRTTQTINGVTTTFCYDQADRLMSSSNALYNGGDYDSHGNMTSVGTGTTPLRLCYDSSDRNTCMTQRDSNGNGVAMYYNRDVQGRVVARFKNTLTNWNAAAAGDYYYGFTGSGDTPDFVRDVNWAVSEKNLQLPGGVLLTIKPLLTGNAQKQYSLPNAHGDTLLTTDAAGTNTSTGNGPASTFTYDPFGQVLSGSTLPANADQGSYGWVGQNEKLTETIFALVPIQMGARVYIPALARFLQVDPVEGGTPSNYVYPPDPMNDFDLNGNLTMPGQYIASPTVAMHQDCTLHGYGACATHFGVGGTIAIGMILAPEVAAPTAAWFANKGAVVSSAAGSKLMNSRMVGVTSNKFGNSSIANSKGIRSVVSGSLNQANRALRAGWSVGPTKKGAAPVFRIKIRSVHIDLFHGHFF
jgi:RHS repeat-associated protein